MAKINRKRAEFGDFQTPQRLANAVAKYLQQHGENPKTIIEPTCGLGSFLVAAAQTFQGAQHILGYDVNATHLEHARGRITANSSGSHIKLHEQDFFSLDWHDVIRNAAQPVLVIGNPPWITASELAQLGSANLPCKSNFQGRRGLDAIMGKANFDIAEYMLIRIAEALNQTGGTFAMLVKTTVARRILKHLWKEKLGVSEAKMLCFDAKEMFGVNADACLLYCKFSAGQPSYRCEICSLDNADFQNRTIGWLDGIICSDVKAFRDTRHLARAQTRPSIIRWRSGVKHDCSEIVELTAIGNRVVNGLGNEIELEDAYLYPLLKGSAVAGGRISVTNRLLLLTQKTVGQDTAMLRDTAPKVWRYLNENKQRFDSRGSSIYAKQSTFAMFGLGSYTFKPYKIAICAMYKKLVFQMIGPIDGRPVAFDDTVYFLSFDNLAAALLVESLLNSELAQTFYSSRIFWDSKRPITVEILDQLDLPLLARELGLLTEMNDVAGFDSDLNIREPLLF